MSVETLRSIAERELDGLGDPTLGEWREWTGVAYHLRRRLTPEEAAPIGPVLDVRGTWDARKRVNALPRQLLRMLPAEVIADEIGAHR